MKVLALVYEDPITREKLEGVASVIIEYGEPDDNGLIKCTVRFPPDPDCYLRKIHAEDFFIHRASNAN